MEEITTLEQLLDDLYDCYDLDDFVSLVNKMNIEADEFTDFQFFSKEHYTRNCIERTDEFELILLCWEEGQDTPIHCHGGSECWVYLVDGEMEEKRYDYNEYDELVVTEEGESKEGDVSFMNDDLGFHTLSNSSKGRSMSLHLYADPIKKCRIYSQSKKGFTYKRMVDYSFKGELIAQPQDS